MTSPVTDDLPGSHRGRHRYRPNGHFRLLSAVGLSLVLLAGFFSLWALDSSAQSAANESANNASNSTTGSGDVSSYTLDTPSIQDQEPSDPEEDEEDSADGDEGNPEESEESSNGSGGNGNGGESSSSELPADVQAVIDATNAERHANGCSDLSNDDQLTAAGMDHSKDMADNDYFSHTSQDGRSPTDRAAEHGFNRGVAENIAYGQPNAEAVVDAWMNSDGHRENILNCDYSVIGVGAVANDSGTVYWVQKFAS